jgi:hypothetical protein
MLHHLYHERHWSLLPAMTARVASFPLLGLRQAKLGGAHQIALRVRDEQLRPALQAEDLDRFYAVLEEQMPHFLQRSIAIATLIQDVRGGSEESPEDVWERLLKSADQFGGELWESTLSRAIKSFERGQRVMARLPSAALSPEHKALVHEASLNLCLWLWSLSCCQLLFEEPRSVSSEIMRELLLMVRMSGQQAYTLPRQVELELRRAAEDNAQADLPFEATAQSGERIALEEDAHQESLRLLAREDV